MCNAYNMCGSTGSDDGWPAPMKKYHPAPKIQKYAIQKKRLKPLPLLGLSQFCFQN